MARHRSLVPLVALWAVSVLILVGLAYVLASPVQPVGGPATRRSIRYLYDCKGISAHTLTILASVDDKNGGIRGVYVSMSPERPGCAPLHFERPPPEPQMGRSYSSRADIWAGDPNWSEAIRWAGACVPLSDLPASPNLQEEWAHNVMLQVALIGRSGNSPISSSSSEYTELRSSEFINNASPLLSGASQRGGMQTGLLISAGVVALVGGLGFLAVWFKRTGATAP